MFHGQYERRKAVWAPWATKERAADKLVAEARKQRDQAQARLESADEQPDKRGPGRPPKAPIGLEQAQLALDAASRAHDRLAQPREQGRQSSRAIGQAYHWVDRERGGRRNGQRLASDIRSQIETMRPSAQQGNLRQRGLERSDKAERVGPKMQATIAFVSGYGRQRVNHLALAQPVSYAMHAQLLPSFSLDRLARSQTVSHG